MNHKKLNNNAFTLTELLIAVVIVGILAGFGIPSYTKAINRAKEKDAVFNLRIIAEAVKMYITREGGPPADLADVNAINTTLTLSIIEQQGNAYTCRQAVNYTCNSINSAGWIVRFEMPGGSNGLVYCTNAACPSCSITGCPY